MAVEESDEEEVDNDGATHKKKGEEEEEVEEVEEAAKEGRISGPYLSLPVAQHGMAGETRQCAIYAQRHLRHLTRPSPLRRNRQSH